ncbi:MAG: trypsin-like peptidase domain-containing protein, partial [Clostridia bacterium]
MKESKKNFFGYIAIAVALAMVVVSSVSLFQMKATAGAEAVQVTENATVVTNPFTGAVQKVIGSVVGVNNYTKYSNSNQFNGFGFGFGSGFGFEDGQSSPDSESSNREVLQGSGSGVVVAKGYVLTNYHVVENASSIEITSGDKVYPAVVVGADENKDIAVVKCETLDLEPVVLGDSDVLNVGDWAICIGNPLSFTGTTTVGVISALNREVANSTTDVYGRRTKSMNTMIQTDAAINAGNSGGGMFNVAGELIGIPSMKYTGSFYSNTAVEGIGMAIPVNEAKDLIQQVLSGKGNVNADVNGKSSSEPTADIASSTPRIGVTVGNMNPSNYAVANGILPNGAYVKGVESGSPAEKA